MLCSWKRYLLGIFLGSDGAAHFLGWCECLFDALFVCGNCDSALDPPSTLYGMPCGKDRGLPSWKLYMIFEWVPAKRFDMWIATHYCSQWRRCKGEGQQPGTEVQFRRERDEHRSKDRRLQGRPGFSEAREPSQPMSCILLAIGQDFALPPEAWGKDSCWPPLEHRAEE